MLYHERLGLTKMSIDDMQRAMYYYISEGHTVDSIVIGDSPEIEEFCKSRGIRHERFRNLPLSNKFSYAWLRAIQSGCEYVAWWGSNNVHSPEYLKACNDVLNGNKVASFGSDSCVIVSTEEGKDETCVFKTISPYLISTGQFFLSYTLKKCINPLTIYEPDQYCNFDGAVLDAMMNMFGKNVVQKVSFDQGDTLDIKNETNIHSYESYIVHKHYDRYLKRDELRKRYPSLDLYLNGHFN